MDKLPSLTGLFVMKRFFSLASLLFLLVLNSSGDPLNSDQIKHLLWQMDSSFVQGHIYHMNYTVSETRTDAYYDHRKALIDLMDAELNKNVNQPPSGIQNPNITNSDKILRDLKKSYSRELTYPREANYTSDYSVDGVGFYMKQMFSFVGSDRKKSSNGPTISVSDGKIMGAFYPEIGKAVIQPATERPQVPTEYWTDIAYRFSRASISEYCDKMQTFKMSEENGKIIIEGDRPGQEKELTHLVLQIDKSSLMPEKMDSVYYTTFGSVDNETVKTWEYQDISGTKWPKVVIDQIYRTDLSGKLNLESEQRFVVNDLSFNPRNAKEELTTLLKSNFSVFDEITGTHYISGNPAGALDKLSE